MTGCPLIDEKRSKDLRSFLNKITDTEVREFIDMKRLYKTEVFTATVQMASEHALRHHDFTFLERILNFLDGTEYADDFVAKLRPKLAFTVTQTVPKKIKKAAKASSANAALPERPVAAAKHRAASLPVKSGKVAKRTAQVNADVNSLSKPKRKVVYVTSSEDLMDSRLMLPGGYGTGRRR